MKRIQKALFQQKRREPNFQKFFKCCVLASCNNLHDEYAKQKAPVQTQYVVLLSSFWSNTTKLADFCVIISNAGKISMLLLFM